MVQLHRKLAFGAMVSVAVLVACSGGSRAPRTSSGTSVLADLTTVETSHHGMGGTQFRVHVEANGDVWIQHGSGPRTPCAALKSTRLEAMRITIRQAMASGLREVYNTSTAPTPNANYSRNRTLELAVDGQRRRLQIGGWADVPAKVAQILGHLSEATRGCPQVSGS